MKLNLEKFYDVLVVGSGIAGLSAAVEAAKQGCSVAIASSHHLFSGSSFYPGTWGFGLIGPENDDDIEDLIASIQRIGCDVADPDMVRTFVSGINPAIEDLESMGCSIRKAGKSTEREYIPCFDHKHRNWNGLETDSLRTVFTKQLKGCNIDILEKCALLDIVKTDGHVCGAIFSYDKEMLYIGCKSLVLATGGYGSLFKNHLCTTDVCGLGQALALKAGCELIHLEFMQMMPGYLYPARNTVFNEKTFRFAKFTNVEGQPIFTAAENDLLDLRSTYGPFTCRLPSSQIDKIIYKASLESPDGVSVSYAEGAKNDPPEFIQVYFDWLATEKHVQVEDTIHVGIFSHAANGGIRIDIDGWTGIPGLFACGEVTGGMHGADRIGGLSTANGLVFGRRAGIAAAKAALVSQSMETSQAPEANFESYAIDNVPQLRSRMQSLMYENAMVVRTETSLTRTLEALEDISKHLVRTPSDDIAAITDARIFEGQLITAMAFLKAALLRRESRGSHCREDYPQMNPEMSKAIHISYDGMIHAAF